MSATKQRVIRDSHKAGTVSKSAVKTAVRKVAKRNGASAPASHTTAPILRRTK